MSKIKTIASSKTQNGLSNVHHFLRDDDLTSEQYCEVLKLALEMRDSPYQYKSFNSGDTVSLIFDKNSTRTRVSFMTATTQLGALPITIDSSSSQLSRGESVADTAHVLERMNKMIVWRTFKQSDIEKMAKNSSVPVINALTDEFHPCQVLADLSAFAYIGSSENLNSNGSVKLDSQYSRLSANEKVEYIKGKTAIYYGDGSNNMAHSYLLGCINAGVNIAIVCPQEYSPNPQIVNDAKMLAKSAGLTANVVNSPDDAPKNADLILTDAWLSMNDNSGEKEARCAILSRYRVDSETMNRANNNALFMHCLPAYRGEEVSGDIIDGSQSAIFEEAEFRVHAQKALMYSIMNNFTF